MLEKLISGFMNRMNELVLSQFPISDLDSDKPFFPLPESYKRAIFEWENSRSETNLKYWRDWNGVFPNEYNSDHMTLFLYLLSRAEANVGRIESADRISYLNKIRNGIDLWHSVSLPIKTVFVHSVGTVLGRAKYGTSLVCYQNVTVGGSKGSYPEFRGSCILYSGVSILGKSIVGTNVTFGAGSLVIDRVIPSDSIVFGRGSELSIRSNTEDRSKEFFKPTITTFNKTSI